MKVAPYKDKDNLYRFDLTDEEAVQRIFARLLPTNPELKPCHIRRSPISREFIIHYIRKDGMEVNAKLGVGQLKRVFGTWILTFTDGGIWFVRNMPKKSKKPH